jgi:hypothetical protein
MLLCRIYGPNRDKVAGERRKLHNGKLYNLRSSPDNIRQIISKRMTWAEHVACIGEGRNVYKVLVGKPEEKRPLGRPRCRWMRLEWILIGRLVEEVWSGFTWLNIGTSGGLS